jgi:predicted RNA-binding protein with RPS1 domain
MVFIIGVNNLRMNLIHIGVTVYYNIIAEDMSGKIKISIRYEQKKQNYNR